MAGGLWGTIIEGGLEAGKYLFKRPIRRLLPTVIGVGGSTVAVRGIYDLHQAAGKMEDQLHAGEQTQAQYEQRLAAAQEKSKQTGQDLEDLLSPEDKKVFREKRGFLENLMHDLGKAFADPKSFGPGSLAGAVGLGLAGGWLGGGFSVAGIFLGIAGALVGMVVPALMGNTSVAPGSSEKVVAKKDEGKTEERKLEAAKAPEPKSVTMTGVNPSVLGTMPSQPLPKVDLVGNKDKATNPTV